MRAFRRSLALSRRIGSRYDEALARLELARFTLIGTLPTRPRDERRAQLQRGSWLRAALSRLRPQRRELRQALRSLLVANAAASALHATSLQVDTLATLAQLSLGRWRLEGDPKRVRAAREFARAAHSITERLRSSEPQLVERLQPLPGWLAPDVSPAPLSVHDPLAATA